MQLKWRDGDTCKIRGCKPLDCWLQEGSGKMNTPKSLSFFSSETRIIVLFHLEISGSLHFSTAPLPIQDMVLELCDDTHPNHNKSLKCKI